MLDAFIIEELRRREERERSDRERPVLELPIDRGDDSIEPPRREDKNGDPDHDRGVVIIDI